jgi:hypothetical protein
MALCYNFTRVLNIIGFNTFMAYLVERALLLLQTATALAIGCATTVRARLFAAMTNNPRSSDSA